MSDGYTRNHEGELIASLGIVMMAGAGYATNDPNLILFSIVIAALD